MNKFTASAMALFTVALVQTETAFGEDIDSGNTIKTNTTRVDTAPAKSLSQNFTASPAVLEAQRTKARERMREDLKIYSKDDLRQIESLYQVANKKWKSEEGNESLKQLIAKYDKANRTGCALLYLGQMTRGAEQVDYLKQAIEKFSNCYYGNGVQVGANARLILSGIYMRNGDKEKAVQLLKEIKTNYPDAITHKGQSLAPMIDMELERISKSGQN